MALDRTFTFPDGTVVDTQPVSSLVIEQILNSEAGKPKVPIVETVVAGKHRRHEPNPKDPDYLKALVAWSADKQKRVMLFLIVKGVVDEPPEDFVAEYAMYLPDGASMDEFKYLWLVDKMADTDVIAALIDHIMSQSAITEEAVEDAAAKFPSDGGGQPDQSVSLSSQTGDSNHVHAGV
jgi:hypothetical protein